LGQAEQSNAMSSVFSTGVVTKHSIASKYLRVTKEVDC
jgi:hypothetical protein